MIYRFMLIVKVNARFLFKITFCIVIQMDILGILAIAASGFQEYNCIVRRETIQIRYSHSLI